MRRSCNPRPAARAPKKSTAWDSYGILLNGDAPPPPAVVEKRKAELSDDYRRNVLKLAEVPAE